MSASSDDMREMADMARAYGEAVYFARADVFEEMCHEKFQMTLIEDGNETFWDKASYLERVRGRQAFADDASYGVISLDVAGGEIGRAHLWVDVPPARYEDHLGFVKVGGHWKLLTKVFRLAQTLDAEG